jgi:hypothetical protein
MIECLYITLSIPFSPPIIIQAKERRGEREKSIKIRGG